MTVAERYERLEQVCAAVALVALGLRYVLPQGITTGLAAALVLAPVWVSRLGRYCWARSYVALGIASIVWGLALLLVSSGTHAVSQHNAYGTVYLTLEGVLGVGVVLWARTVFAVPQLGFWYALGLLAHAKLYPGVLGASNPLKFNWLVPLAVLVFSLAYGASRQVQLALAVVLAVVAGIADARAIFGTALISAVLLLWQLPPRATTRRGSWVWISVMLGALGYAVYSFASTLLIDGYLGTAAQQRSIMQVERSGSLLLGGRPELSATWALLRSVPQGFGPGTIANISEINIAKAGMASINYDPNNGYVDRFMFGSSVELHSTFGDLWAAFGVPGIALSLLIVVIVVVGVSRLVASRRGTALVFFFGIWVLWNMAFSPLLSAVPTLFLALALLMAEQPRVQQLGNHLEELAPRASFGDPGQEPAPLPRLSPMREV